MSDQDGPDDRNGPDDRAGPARALALLPAILSGLILRRSGLVPANDRGAGRSGGASGGGGKSDGGSKSDGGGESGGGQASDRGEAPGRHGRAGGGAPYETRDVRVGRTGLVVAGLALTVAAVIAGLVWMRDAFEAAQRAALPPLTRMQTTPVIPPAPNLQPNPYADIDRILAAQARALETYGFADPERTRARIPIDRAMSLTLGRSLDP